MASGNGNATVGQIIQLCDQMQKRRGWTPAAAQVCIRVLQGMPVVHESDAYPGYPSLDHPGFIADMLGEQQGMFLNGAMVQRAIEQGPVAFLDKFTPQHMRNHLTARVMHILNPNDTRDNSGNIGLYAALAYYTNQDSLFTWAQKAYVQQVVLEPFGIDTVYYGMLLNLLRPKGGLHATEFQLVQDAVVTLYECTNNTFAKNANLDFFKKADPTGVRRAKLLLDLCVATNLVSCPQSSTQPLSVLLTADKKDLLVVLPMFLRLLRLPNVEHIGHIAQDCSVELACAVTELASHDQVFKNEEGTASVLADLSIQNPAQCEDVRSQIKYGMQSRYINDMLQLCKKLRATPHRSTSPLYWMWPRWDCQEFFDGQDFSVLRETGEQAEPMLEKILRADHKPSAKTAADAALLLHVLHAQKGA